jgi:hypothetical protein
MNAPPSKPYEARCWEFTGAAFMCEAQGAYRGPTGTTYVFVTFGEPRLTKQT